MVPIADYRIRQALNLYNQAIADHDTDYLVLSEEQFMRLFLTPVKEKDQVFSCCCEDGSGFIVGHFDHVIERFFLTMIAVAPEKRRQGIGSRLVEALQQEMDLYAEKNLLPPPALEISFYNPVNIRWVIPGTDHHTHQNSQGVPLGSGAHLFFKNLGFRDFACQNTYHMDIPSYQWPTKKLAPYEKRLSDAGLSVDFFDGNRHHGMQDVVDDLNNAIWNWQIPEEMNRPSGPRPMLIVNDHGQCGGFAGPIVVEPDGRCWILGVAVHSRYRGHGAATILFNRMCQAFKEAGAKYLTLFTDEKNPARNIYESAGMKIVYSWADMRRVHP